MVNMDNDKGDPTISDGPETGTLTLITSKSGPKGPWKFIDEVREVYLEALRQGGGRMSSAAIAGVSPNTVARYAEEHPEFREEIAFAELFAANLVEESLHASALKGNTIAQIFYLTNRSPERWQDRRGSPFVADEAIVQEINALKKRLGEIENHSTVEGEVIA